MINRAKETRINEKTASLSLKEKAALVTGAAVDRTAALPGQEIRPLGIARAESGIVFCGTARGTFLPAEERGILFPTPASLARSFDPALTARVAAWMAEECRARDVEICRVPGLTVKRDPRDGGDSFRFSEDPVLCGEMAAAFVDGMASRGVTVCLDGYGLPAGERQDRGSRPWADPLTEASVYLAPLERAAQKADVIAVSPVNGSFQRPSQERELREGLQFRGPAMDLTGCCADPVAALASGIDVVVCGDSDGARQVVNAVENGDLSAERLDEAVKRFLYLYEECLSNSPVVLKPDEAVGHALALQSARESMVLLRNEEGILPFAPGQRIALIGYGAAHPLGAPAGCPEETARVASFLDAFREEDADVIYAQGYDRNGDTNPRLIEEARAALQSAGAGVLVLTPPWGSEGTGADRSGLSLPNGLLKLTDLLLETGVPVVCVLNFDSPLELPFESRIPAFLLAGYAGEATAAAAAQILFGHHNPAAKLAQTWPFRLRDLPVAGSAAPSAFREGRYHGYHRYESTGEEPLFRFGTGLSYTPMKLISARCERRTIAGERQRIPIRLSLRNQGDRCACFALQLYAGRKDDPCRRLVAVRKLSLLPGAVETVQVDVPAGALREYDPAQRKYRLSKGEYLISLSHSSGAYGALGYFPLEVEPKEGGELPLWHPFRELKDRKKEGPAEEPETGFTADSTLKELSVTLAGRLLYERVRAALEEEGIGADSPAGLAVQELPVRFLPAVSRGRFGMKRVIGTVEMVSGKALKGAWKVIGSK